METVPWIRSLTGFVEDQNLISKIHITMTCRPVVLHTRDLGSTSKAMRERREERGERAEGGEREREGDI